MNLNSIKYQIGKAGKQDIIEHLEKCDQNFSPQLSSYVNINEYSQKIFSNAVTFEAWENDKLIGLVAAYLNDQKSYEGFITNVSVFNNHARKGIAKQLLLNCEEYANKVGFKYLSLDVHPGTNAFFLYTKIGFINEGLKGKKFKMRKRLDRTAPLVSICCVTYNHAKFIREALESFLMQRTNFSFEILIHDDASTDGTAEIIREFEEKYNDKIKSIYQKENQYSKGVSISATFNFPRAHGKYIALCEGDDYWTDSNKLHEQVDFLEANPNYAGCFHETEQIFEDGKSGRIYGKNAPDTLTAEHTFATLSPFHTSSLVFRNILGKLPSWFSTVVSGDMALFSIISSHGPLKKIPEIMSVYRKHENGITNTAYVTNNFHQKRIKLMNYLNEYHDFKYNDKAMEVIDYHKQAILKEQKENENNVDNNYVIPHWSEIKLPEVVKSAITMLSMEERKLLYLLGKYYWTGAGCVVDAGCFLGGSTLSLAMGIKENKNKASKENVIHSYDLFVADSHQAEKYLKKFGNYSAGDSIRSLFDKNTAEVKNSLVVHEGDLLSFPWYGNEIEILFIDVAKTWELNDFVVKEFFPGLIPNQSVVIQQDFVHPTCPWLAITMEYFSEYFEPVEYVPNNSIVFNYVKKIPQSKISSRSISQLTLEEKLSLMDKAIIRYQQILEKDDMVELECGMAILKLWLLGVDEAQKNLNEIKEKYKHSGRIDDAVQWVEKRIAKHYTTLSRSDNFLNMEMNPANMDLYIVRTSIKKVIDNSLNLLEGTLLDLGCGEMPYKHYILSNSKVEKYIGLDIENPTYQKNTKPDLFWDGNKIPLENDSVDCVLATEFFEHVPYPEKILAEVKRVLKPGGLLLLTVPFIWPLHTMPYDEYRYTPFSLERILKNSGFDDINIKALGGWNASFAQVMGLWIRRSPMTKEVRNSYTEAFFPFYKSLIETDEIPDNFDESMLITGLTALAKKKVDREIKINNLSTGVVNHVECPVCGQTFEKFKPYGANNIPNRCCPECGTVERHRLLWLYLTRKRNILSENLNLLDIAPTKGISNKLKSMPNINYLSIDLTSPLAMKHMDITALDLPDNFYDCVICYHVFEHIPDDRKAMREVLRVLKPGGWAILQVPIKKGLEKTHEGAHIQDPAERRRLFGQEDHVRYYGLDYKDRLSEEGFIVNVDNFAKTLTDEEVKKYRLIQDEEIYFCTKPLINNMNEISG